MRALLALFFRSLKEDIRSRSTYIVRAALVALVLFFLWVTHEEQRWSGAVGLSFFRTIIGIDLFVLSIVGLTYFASSVTEEKEGDTLGLLRMTDLSSLSILLGKSTARLLGALFILGAQLPFMLLAVTMGGVATRQILAGFTCLTAYAFVLANLGTLWSVLCRRTALATTATAASIGGLFVLPWFLYDRWMTPTNVVDEVLLAWRSLSPLSQVQEISLTTFDGDVVSWPVLASLLIGVGCFVSAWKLFDRFADSDVSDAPTYHQGKPVVVPETPSPARALAGRAKTPAMRWKDFHHIAGGSTAIVIKSVITTLIAILSMGVFNVTYTKPSEAMGLYGGLLAFWSALLLGLCVALDASRIFKRERDAQTLSSLMMLPLSPRRLCWEKMIGCLRASIPPAIGVGVGALVLGIGIVTEIATRGYRPYNYAFYVLGAASYGVLTCALLPMLIAWLSLLMRWGALPIGITIWFFGNWIVGFICGAIFEEGCLLVLPIIAAVLIGVLWARIPRKLEELAQSE